MEQLQRRFSWWNTCPVCFSDEPSSRHAQVCDACHTEIEQHARKVGTGCRQISLYRYRLIIRELILRAKVQSDHKSLDLLLTLAARHPASLKAASWADVVVVCPSSLWGRLRGRLDLAHHVATALSRQAGKDVHPSPPHLYWQLRKRARHKQGDQVPYHRASRGLNGFWRKSLERWRGQIAKGGTTNRPLRVLIVDDVITTGKTMLAVADHLPEAALFRGLTLAAGDNFRSSTLKGRLIDMDSTKSTENLWDIS